MNLTPAQKKWHEENVDKKKKAHDRWLKRNKKRRRMIALKSYYKGRVKKLTAELEVLKH